MSGTVSLEIVDRVAHVTFDNPGAYNAMTFAMYGKLAAICETLQARPELVATVFRGAGGKAFVAGTDISEFTAFGDADGPAYEARVEAVVSAVEALPMPTIALVTGAAMGGGLALATACDFRLMTPKARFGVPIARTVGNCLASRNIARLERAFGLAATRRMLFLAQSLGAEEALALGYGLDIVEADAIEAALATLVATLAGHAPLTLRATKQSLRRLADNNTDDADLIASVYASADFREGVRAFLDKRTPQWGVPASGS